MIGRGFFLSSKLDRLELRGFSVVDPHRLELVTLAQRVGHRGARLRVGVVGIGDRVLVPAVDLEEDGRVRVEAVPPLALEPVTGTVLDSAGCARPGAEPAGFQKTPLEAGGFLEDPQVFRVVKGGLQLIAGVLVAAHHLRYAHHGSEGDALFGRGGGGGGGAAHGAFVEVERIRDALLVVEEIIGEGKRGIAFLNQWSHVVCRLILLLLRA